MPPITRFLVLLMMPELSRHQARHGIDGELRHVHPELWPSAIDAVEARLLECLQLLLTVSRLLWTSRTDRNALLQGRLGLDVWSTKS